MIELGSGDPAQANTARVKFTVRTAGVYIVSISIGELCDGIGFRALYLRETISCHRRRGLAGGEQQVVYRSIRTKPVSTARFFPPTLEGAVSTH